MPNYSETYIKFQGDIKNIAEVRENIKRYGLNWGRWKQPKILDTYTAPLKIVDDSEWTDIAKEYRRKPEKDFFTKKQILKKMKRSVHDRLMKKHGAHNWYDWRIKHWGMKWNLEDDTEPFSETEDTLEYSFLSPWSGPNEWFKEVCKEYGFNGTYIDFEAGQDFFHRIDIENGEVVYETTAPLFSEEAIESLGLNRLLEEYDPEYKEELKKLLPEYEKEIEEFYKQELSA